MFNEKQKKNKKTCAYQFLLLTVKSVMLEAWFDYLFLFSFFFRFYRAKDMVNLQEFMTYRLHFTKKMDGCLLEFVLTWLGKSS